MNQGIKHIEIAVSDLKKSLIFYDTLFATIGWQKVERNGFVCGNIKVYFKTVGLPKGEYFRGHVIFVFGLMIEQWLIELESM